MGTDCIEIDIYNEEDYNKNISSQNEKHHKSTNNDNYEKVDICLACIFFKLRNQELKNIDSVDGDYDHVYLIENNKIGWKTSIKYYDQHVLQKI